MNKGKRLLYVFNASWFFLSHRKPFALAAQAAGYEVHVAAAPHPGDVELIESLGLTFHPLPFARRGMNPWQEFRTICSLWLLYISLKPHLVEHATIKPVLYGNLVSKLLGRLRSVNWMTGLGYVFICESKKASLLRSMVVATYRAALRRDALKVIFENPDDRKRFIEERIVEARRSLVIRGAGVDTGLFVPSPEPAGPVLVVLPARMLWDKGVGEFVEAARLIKSRGSAARFVLVGDCDQGNPASVAAETLRGWEQEGVVEWWGRRNDMAAVFAKAHLVCLPSYREGLPKVLLEAAASGRPIVTTDVPGCREVVKEGVNGLLVPVKDSLRLAEALLSLVQDAELRRWMGARGRQIVLDEFSEEKVVAETLNVYRELLAL